MNNSPDPFIVLVGGLSRSGKSSLVTEVVMHLKHDGVDSFVLPLDYWIVPTNLRNEGSSVLERFRIGEAIYVLRKILNEGTHLVRPYDAVTGNESKHSIQLHAGPTTRVVIIEGVVALVDPRFLEIADYAVYVQVDRFTRLRRLIKYHRDVKNLPRSTYLGIIRQREIEEVPTIALTRALANLIVADKDAKVVSQELIKRVKF